MKYNGNKLFILIRLQEVLWLRELKYAKVKRNKLLRKEVNFLPHKIKVDSLIFS